MKQNLKNIIAQLLVNEKVVSQAFTMRQLCAFCAILFAKITLKKKRNIDFEESFNLLKKFFPKLISDFEIVNIQLSSSEIVFFEIDCTNLLDKNDENIDDVISWTYQFMTQHESKNAFARIGKNKEKLNERETLLTTQFFTDKYMVQYIVDTALGKIIDIENLLVIDAACGGGNFLTYTFDKLFYHFSEKKKDWNIQQIVDFIIDKVLIGYDLDNNLVEFAKLSLWLKATSYAVPSKSIKIFGGKSDDKLGFFNRKIISSEIDSIVFQDYLHGDSFHNKQKVFVTNPPFMGKRDMDIELKCYLQDHFSSAKADLCTSFVQKTLSLMKEDDYFGFVGQNNWLYLSSLKNFRKLVLSKYQLETCIDLGTNAFEDINGEKTNVALCFFEVQQRDYSIFYDLKKENYKEKKRILQNHQFADNQVFKVQNQIFRANESFEFNYQLANRFVQLQDFPLYGIFAKPMQGTSTGDNVNFVKYAWEVNGSPDWKLVSKGGGFSKWSGLNYYKVLWGKNGEKIKQNKGSAIRNLDKMACTQLVFSDTGTLGLNVRLLKKEQVFIASGPGIQVLAGNQYAHLAFLNSKIATFLLKLINPKFTISAGYIARIPVPQNVLFCKEIAAKSQRCYQLKEEYLSKKLPNFEFQHFDYTAIGDIHKFVECQIINDLKNDFERFQLEQEIEQEIIKNYHFNTQELTEIGQETGSIFSKKVIDNQLLTIEKIDALLNQSIDINCMSISRTINGYSVGSDSVLEYLAHKMKISPEYILHEIIQNINLFEKTKQKYLNDLWHKMTLKMLNIEHISKYYFKQENLDELVIEMKSSFECIRAIPNFELIISNIIKHHHKVSFFQKPLVTMIENKLLVGTPHNE